MLAYAMLKDYKRLNLSSLAKKMPINYQARIHVCGRVIGAQPLYPWHSAPSGLLEYRLFTYIIHRPASRLNNERLQWRFTAAFAFSQYEKEHRCFEAQTRKCLSEEERARLQPMRTASEIQVKIIIQPLQRGPLYQKLAKKAEELALLGMSLRSIAKTLKISKKMTTNAYRYRKQNFG